MMQMEVPTNKRRNLSGWVPAALPLHYHKHSIKCSI